MKHSREIRVGILAVVCLCLLYFGFNFLKGVNIFSPTHGYVGRFERVNSLTEQAPVYIKGYKVGQVEKISYDFTHDTAFTVVISIDKGIQLPIGTMMALIPDGLISGMAIELYLPEGTATALYAKGDTLPTTIVPGLVEGLQTGFLANLDSLMSEANTLLAVLNDEMNAGSLRHSLDHVEVLTNDLTAVGKDLKRFSHNQLPELVAKVDTTVDGLNAVIDEVRAAEIQHLLQQVDSAVQDVRNALASDEGTVGMLLHDKAAYENLNRAIEDLDHAVLNVDTVVMSVKAHPCIKKRIPKQ